MYTYVYICIFNQACSCEDQFDHLQPDSFEFPACSYLGYTHAHQRRIGFRTSACLGPQAPKAATVQAGNLCWFWAFERYHWFTTPIHISNID